MEDRRALTVRISTKAHLDLKIISALTGRPIGDLIEEMIFRYKGELADERVWDDDARNFIVKKQSELKQAKSVFEQRKEKAEHKRMVMELIGKLRDDEGLTFDEIASKLQVDGYQTLTGKGDWQGGSVFKLYKKHKDSSLPTMLDLIRKNAPYGGMLEESDKWKTRKSGKKGLPT